MSRGQRRSCSPGNHGVLLVHEQNLADHLLLIPALHDFVHKAVVQQELGPLEAFRQLLADGLLDHPGTGKTDQRSRLRKNNVAQHCETGRHAAGGGIGEHADEQLSGLVVAL